MPVKSSLPLIFTSVLMLAACGNRPTDSSFSNRGGPESLIDVSSEVVSLATQTTRDREQLADWIAKDQPTRAELNCTTDSLSCTEAEKILELSGVPIVGGNTHDNSVTLIYERILARDCDQRYIDDPHNFYNLNHASFGCATAANMVQHITNKQSLISPALSDDPSAERAVNDMKRAFTPREIVEPYTVDQSLTNKASSGGGN